jgi:hypothetical protein
MKIIFIIAVFLALYALWERLTGNTFNGLYFGKSKIQEKGTAIPFDGNIFMNYWVVKKAQFSSKESVGHASNLIAAFLMKWIQEGRIEVLPGEALRIGEEGTFDDSLEAELYRMIVDAGGENHILNSDSFALWAKSYSGILAPYPARAQKHGEELLAAQGFLDKDQRPIPEAFPRVRQAIELKNFLKDIGHSGLSPERPWEDYLVTGVLLGCGEQVRKQISVTLPVNLSSGLDAVESIARGYIEAERQESMANWYQSNP